MLFVHRTLQKFVQVVLVATLLAPVSAAQADNSFVSQDNNLTFSYPKRWKAETAGDKIELTASDGVKYLLQSDTLDPYRGDSPAFDTDLKEKATKRISSLIPKPNLVSATSLTMSHGFGAVYRFRPSGNQEGATTSLYFAFIGKHSLVAMPEKAGQSSQAIGMSAVFQSISFTDSLPKAPIARPNLPGKMTPKTLPANLPKVGTVSYVTQIAPIMKESCEVCHNSRSALGGLSVSKFSDFVKGGRHSDDVVPGRPESSLLMDYLTGRRTLMPKGGSPLSEDKIALIRKWIAEGARETPDSPVPMSASEEATPDKVTTPSLPFNRKKKGKAQDENTTQNGADLTRLPLPEIEKRPGKGRKTDDVDVVLEAHSGHLLASDISFTLKLRKSKNATATWEVSPGRELQYVGTYVGEDGNYFVKLDLAGPTEGVFAKSLSLSLRGKGGMEFGQFGLNGNAPFRNISSISLSEIHDDSKMKPAARRPANRRKKQP